MPTWRMQVVLGEQSSAMSVTFIVPVACTVAFKTSEILKSKNHYSISISLTPGHEAFASCTFFLPNPTPVSGPDSASLAYLWFRDV